MGCCFSSNADASATTSQQQQLQQQNAGHQSASEQQALAPSKREAPTKQYTKPKWKAPQPMSEARLQVGGCGVWLGVPVRLLASQLLARWCALPPWGASCCC
jgi:hypothetical protein